VKMKDHTSFFHISAESCSGDTSLEDVLECDFGVYLT
jgi:hypothetical protein